METHIFFKHREVAIETLWWMMSQDDRYKVDKVEIFDHTRKVSDMEDDETLDDYAYINYRYFKEGDDHAVQEYARNHERVSVGWDVRDPDLQNLEMLEVCQAAVQLKIAYESGGFVDSTYELFRDILWKRVMDVTDLPPGPSANLVQFAETLLTEGDDCE